MTINFDTKSIKGLNVVVLSGRADEETRKELVEFLKSEGVKAWSQDSLIGGQDWEYETLRAISDSHFIFLLASPSGVTELGFFQKTIKAAKAKAAEFPEGHIFLLPIVLEEPVRLMGYLQPLRIKKDDDWEKLGPTLEIALKQRQAF